MNKSPSTYTICRRDGLPITTALPIDCPLAEVRPGEAVWRMEALTFQAGHPDRMALGLPVEELERRARACSLCTSDPKRTPLMRRLARLARRRATDNPEATITQTTGEGVAWDTRAATSRKEPVLHA